MVLELLIQLFFGLIHLLLLPLPNLPDVPSAISNGLTTIGDVIGQAIGVIGMLLTPALTIAVVTIALLILAFDYIYRPLFWMIKKVPFINIK